MWEPKNIMEALFPLSVLNGIVFHGTFQYPIGRPRLLFSRVYSIILGSLFWVIAFYSIPFVLVVSGTSVQDKIAFASWAVPAGCGPLVHITNVYYAKVFLVQMERIMKIDDTLKQLGVKMNYKAEMNMGIFIMIFWGATGFSSSMCTFFAAPEPVWWIVVMEYGIYHIYHTSLLVGLNFAFVVRIVETRIRKVNEMMEDLSGYNFYQQRNSNPWYFWRNNNAVVNPRSSPTLRSICQSDRDRNIVFHVLKHLHLELGDIASRLTEIYGVPIVLTAINFFSSVIHSIFNMVKFQQNYSVLDDFWRAKLIIETFAISAILIGLNGCCERAQAEAAKTGSLLCGIRSMTKDPEFRKELEQFSVQLLINPLSFRPCGLFTLGNAFLLSFVDGIITFAVLMIQADPETRI